MDLVVFTELERDLLLRALNTERNFLAKLYGYWHGVGNKEVKAQYYTSDTYFRENTNWQEQIDALNLAEDKLYEMEVSE